MPLTTPSQPDARPFIKSVHGLRYHVKDVARSVAFCSATTRPWAVIAIRSPASMRRM